MADKEFFVGSFGPYIFDDTDVVTSRSGTFDGETREAFMTEGQMWVGEDPSYVYHVARYQNLLNLEAEAFYLSLLNG